jgi:uncharacterized membrane protein YfcA
VNWRLVARIGNPGAIGAFAGATVLSNITASWLKPAVALVLFGLGTLVIVRSVRGDLRGERHDPGHLRARFLAPLGLSAGFLDAVGGGGWGPVATPTLLAAWLVRHADASVLGVVVGTLLLITNARTLMLEVGTAGPVRMAVIVAIAAVGASITLRVREHSRAHAERVAASASDSAPDSAGVAEVFLPGPEAGVAGAAGTDPVAFPVGIQPEGVAER